MLKYWIMGAVFGFAAAVQPGPLLTYIISQTLSTSWRRAVPAAFAPLVSDGPIVVLVLLVLTRLPSWMETMLHILGGLFLLYLAYGAYRTWQKYDAAQTAKPSSIPKNVFKAATVNWLNPNPYLGWSLVLGPLVLTGWRESPAHGLALVLGFYVTMIVTLIGLITLFSAARSLGTRISRGLIAASAIALAGFALYQLWRGLFSNG